MSKDSKPAPSPPQPPPSPAPRPVPAMQALTKLNYVPPNDPEVKPLSAPDGPGNHASVRPVSQ